MLRRLTNRIEVATVVVPGDLPVVRDEGFANVLLLRNAPMSDWRAAYRPPAPRNDGPLRAVIIGSIFEDRGYEAILHAIAICNRTNMKVTLRVIGPGRASYMSALKKLVSELDIEDAVEWWGPMDSSDISNAYLDSDVGLVLYETTHKGNDGLSNKILECVSSGRPVIASDLPENRRFVTSNRVGWMSGMAPSALADALEAVADRDDLPELSRRCRDLGDRELTWEQEFAPLLSAVTRAAPLDSR
jgi:glycosyltransferase involved in cell wall biosynthesis